MENKKRIVAVNFTGSYDKNVKVPDELQDTQNIER